MLLRGFEVVIFLAQTTRISTAESYEGLLQEMRNAPNKTEAGLLFYANILGTNVTEVARLIQENPRTFLADYAINYVGFLKRVTKLELEEMGKLTGSTVSYEEYLRKWVNRGGDYDEEYWVSSLIEELRKANKRESANFLFAFTTMVRVAVYRTLSEIFYLSFDENNENVTHLTEVQTWFFNQEVIYSVYEMFGQASDSHLMEVARITNNTQVKHIIALKEAGIKVEVQGILDTLRKSENQKEAEIAFWWYMFGGNLTEAMVLRRKNRPIFNSVMVSKIEQSGFFDQANKYELEEIGNLTGFTILKDLDTLLILPRRDIEGKHDRVQALLKSLRDAQNGNRLVEATYLMSLSATEAKIYYTEKEGGDPESIGDVYNVDLADVLYQAEEKQLDEILELLDWKPESTIIFREFHLFLGCIRVTILDVSFQDKIYFHYENLPIALRHIP